MTRAQRGLGDLLWLVATAAVGVVLIAIFDLLSRKPVGRAGPATPPLRLATGYVTGMEIEGSVRVYKGIPYAAAPVGALRWRPPQPVAPWEGLRAADRFGPACPQPAAPGILDRKYESKSEDCLYLNAWTPAAEGDRKRPIMVWIHGGGFITGSASDDFYDARNLARQGVVVFSFNYRLGPFGFFAHPALSKESEHGVSGNYGLLDQIAALEWVRDNGAAFGGDTSRILVFGESGGARSIACLMVSPLAQGLFARAAIESSTVFRPIQHLRESWYGRPPMESVGAGIARALGAPESDPLPALRARSADEIMAASNPGLPGYLPSQALGTPFEPIVDGHVIPDDPGDLFEQGRQAKVPLIAGSNADESTLFTMKKRFMRQAAYQEMIRRLAPDHAEEVLRMFPGASAYRDLNQVSTDMSCTAPMRSTVGAMTRAGAPAWLYQFTHIRSSLLGRMLGAWHGSEMRFIFDSLDDGGEPVRDADRRLARIMSGYWVRFAANGDPNGPDLPAWPAYDVREESYVEFGDRVQVKQGLRRESCDLFAGIEADRRAHRRAPATRSVPDGR